MRLLSVVMGSASVYNEDGTVNVPEVLRPYMGGTKILEPKK